jgi:hypothetical protein
MSDKLSIEMELLASLEALLFERDVLATELADTLPEKDDAAKQIRALRAIVFYFGRIGLVSELLSPLVSLIGELQEKLDKREGEGTRNAVKPLILAQRHAACAAAVDYLKMHAVPLKDALASVARLTDLEPKQLDDLRRSVRTGRARPWARTFYKNCMKRNEELFDLLPMGARKAAVLKSIAKIMDQPI